MIDWEEIIKSESIEELKQAKLWLFREYIRLQNEEKELNAAKDKFLKERVRLRNELDELNRRTVSERKRLREENLFFDKKMDILKEGFRKLEDDRRAFDREKRLFAQERMNAEQEYQWTERGPVNDNVIATLFRNATNPLTLRKRYRDLVKVFHPDNLLGDAELMQLINKEFAKRKEEM
jgi:hypothetical protein